MNDLRSLKYFRFHPIKEQHKVMLMCCTDCMRRNSLEQAQIRGKYTSMRLESLESQRYENRDDKSWSTASICRYCIGSGGTIGACRTIDYLISSIQCPYSYGQWSNGTQRYNADVTPLDHSIIREAST